MDTLPERAMFTRCQRQTGLFESDCRSTDTCDLKRFTLTMSVYEVWFSDDPDYPTYGNGVVMEYETGSLDALEKYAIGQFVKGCVFHSSKNGQGKINRDLSYRVTSFGENIPFCFPQWVIDSQDSDPEHGRFYLLRWNKPGSYDNRTQKLRRRQTENSGCLHDRLPRGIFYPSSANERPVAGIQNCIYKASEVPTQTRRDFVNLQSPSLAYSGKTFTSTILTRESSRAFQRISRGWKSHPRR